MKKLIIIFSISIFIVFNLSNVYAVVNDIYNHWAYSQVIRGVNNEWINGYEDNTFRPDNNIRRNEFIKILVSAIDDNIEINKTNWERPYINYAYELKLLNSKDLDYNKLITRKEIFEIVYNYIDFLIEDKEIYNKYKDKEDLNKYIDLDVNNERIKFLINSNIITGYVDNTIRLNENITRAEAITIICRVLDFIDNSNYQYEYGSNIFNNNDITKYTNYNGDNELFLNTYKVNGQAVIYSDKGRLSIYNNKSIEKYSEYVIQILLSLYTKNLYVLNIYNPELKDVCISLGENKEYLDNNNSLFNIILYEEKQYINGFQYDGKINIYKLWKELNDIKQNNKTNEKYLIKLNNLLEIFLSKEQSNDIVSNIQNNVYFSQNANYYFEKVNNCYYIYFKVLF